MTRIAFILGFAAIVTFFAMDAVDNTAKNIKDYHAQIEQYTK